MQLKNCDIRLPIDRHNRCAVQRYKGPLFLSSVFPCAALDGGVEGAVSWFTSKESPHGIDSTSFLPLPPPTTCCSPPATHLTVGGSSGIVAGSSKTGDVTPSTVVGSLGIVDGSSKIRDMVLAWRGTSFYFITLRWSRRCACSMEEGVAGAERLFARVLLMARTQDLSTWPSNIARSRCCWVAIPILPWMTAQGSWVDMVHCFQQSMRECIK